MPETSTAERPAVEDIYALLGVQPDVSGTLAREMYWNQMEPLLEADRRDAGDTRARIESLNEALTIILDDRLRAEYDASRRRREAGERPVTARAAPASTSRRFLAAALVFLGLVASAAAFAVAVVVGPALALRLVPVALPAAVLFVAAWAVARRRAAAPLEMLGLLPGAGRSQIDIAYRARAQELLIRLAYDAGAVRSLDELDRAYVTAMAVALEPEGRPTRRGRAGRLAFAAGRLLVRLVQALWGLLTLAGRAAGPLLAMLLRAAGRGGRAVAARTRASGSLDDAPATTIPTIDLERRLAASFKASTLQIAAAVEPDVAQEPALDAAPAAWLLLEAAVGTRRVPITSRPIRIGSARECDLVLPGRAGVAAEHVMVWRRGDAVILHVTDPQAECTVNDAPVSWARLDDGDTLAVGSVIFRIESEPPA